MWNYMIDPFIFFPLYIYIFLNIICSLTVKVHLKNAEIKQLCFLRPIRKSSDYKKVFRNKRITSFHSSIHVSRKNYIKACYQCKSLAWLHHNLCVMCWEIGTSFTCIQEKLQLKLQLLVVSLPSLWNILFSSIKNNQVIKTRSTWWISNDLCLVLV